MATISNLVDKACLDAAIAAAIAALPAPGTTEVGDGVTVAGAGTAASPFKAGNLIANADGSFTWTSATGAAFNIPKDCCPTLVKNADGSYTFTHGDGSTVNIPVAGVDVKLASASIDTATNELVLTLSDGTPFRVPLSSLIPVVADGVTVTGDGTAANPLKAGDLAANPDGSYTYTRADGTQITIAAPCCTADGTTVTGSGSAAAPWKAGDLVDNGDGSFTYTKADGTQIIIPASSGTTEVGDGTTVIGAGTAADPFKAGDLAANPDGTYTYTRADGTQITIPAACCTPDGVTVGGSGSAGSPWTANKLVSNGDGTYTWQDAAGNALFTIPADCCPTLVKNADGSYTFTAGDGSTTVIDAIPVDIKLANATIDTATNELVFTLTDGTVFRVPLSSLLPVVADQVTVAGDGTVNNPLRANKLVDNGDGTYSWQDAAGNTLFTIPADCCPTLVDNGDGTYTYTHGDGTTVTISTTPVMQKQVINPGTTTLPITDVTDAGLQDLLNSGTIDQSAETTDIIPTIGPDGVRRWEIRNVGIKTHQYTIAGVPTTVAPNTIAAVSLGGTIDRNDYGAFTYAAHGTQMICTVPGRYMIHMCGVTNIGGVSPGTTDLQPHSSVTQPELRHHIYVNGALQAYTSEVVPSGTYINTRNVSHDCVDTVVDLKAGDVIEGRIRNVTNQTLVSYFSDVSIERIGPGA